MPNAYEQNTGAAAVVATAVTATFRSSENGDQDDTLRANNMLQDQDAKELALNWQADDVFHFAQQCRRIHCFSLTSRIRQSYEYHDDYNICIPRGRMYEHYRLV